jgi:hypothetical protein
MGRHKFLFAPRFLERDYRENSARPGDAAKWKPTWSHRSGHPYALTEVQVPNADGRLFPGAYAQVHLVLPVKPVMLIPTNALLFRSDGTQIGIVDGNGIVHLRNVTIGHEFGTTVEATQSVSPEDRIIVDPSDALADGVKVQATEEAAK